MDGNKKKKRRNEVGREKGKERKYVANPLERER